MTRLPHIYLPCCPQHAIQRGNNREACFHADEDDQTYIACLKDAAENSKWLCTRFF